MEADVRWQQRFSNDCRALEQLDRATAALIASHIHERYLTCFRQLRTTLEKRLP